MAHLRFGKHPPKHDYRTLRLKNYLTSKLAAPPATCDVLARVFQNLDTTDVAALFPMDANDSLGDCTIAGAAHAVTAYRGLVRKRSVMKTTDVVKTYYKLTGGVDSGLNVLDVVNYWRQTGIAGEKILAFASLDLKNHTHVEQAIDMFGGVYLGFQVQEGCVEAFNAGTPWTPARLTRDGHCVFAVGYDADGVTVLTWGGKQKGTWGWWDECVDEAYALLPPDAKKADFSPGFAFDELMADLQAVAD